MKFDLRMLGRVPPPRLIDEQTVIMLLRNICQFVPCFSVSEAGIRQGIIGI